MIVGSLLSKSQYLDFGSKRIVGPSSFDVFLEGVGFEIPWFLMDVMGKDRSA